jgi:hypothetical protein
MFSESRRQNFYRYITAELRIARTPDFTHPAFANREDNRVLSDRCVGEMVSLIRGWLFPLSVPGKGFASCELRSLTYKMLFPSPHRP